MTGNDIRAFRQRHGLSQFRLAVLLDVAPQTIAAWEQKNMALPTLTGEAVAARLEAHEKISPKSPESA